MSPLNQAQFAQINKQGLSLSLSLSLSPSISLSISLSLSLSLSLSVHDDGPLSGGSLNFGCKT